MADAITVGGVSYHSIRAACRAFGVSDSLYTYRTGTMGMTPEVAITTPVKERKDGERYEGKSAAEWARVFGVANPVFHRRKVKEGSLSGAVEWYRTRPHNAPKTELMIPEFTYMGYTAAEWLGMLRIAPRSIATEWKASGDPESFLELVVHRRRMNGLDGYSLADMSIMLDVPEHVLALWYYKDGGGVSMYDALECNGMLDKWDTVSHFDKGVEVAASKGVWSTEEDAILSGRYPYVGIAVCELLPGRTKGAVKAHASELGLSASGGRMPHVRAEHMLVCCPVCGAKVLLPHAVWLKDFVHGPMCETYLWEEANV